MAYVRDQTVDIPPASNKLPPNPLLDYNRTHTATASAKPLRTSITQSTLACQVLLYLYSWHSGGKARSPAKEKSPRDPTG
ncbi:hypothetical protein BDM02DRAFT_2733106 [Thelephora ganbajun]|uniref:Uncharacterized protein n=1 Tax=Thelephora ganbajun TaxID=370292 RepID=A0ACB6ZCH6_THEGA|nr:hypothetical protein BDM02DRAFT_2733106 [Thelephora ganbajun]